MEDWFQVKVIICWHNIDFFHIELIKKSNSKNILNNDATISDKSDNDLAILVEAIIYKEFNLEILVTNSISQYYCADLEQIEISTDGLEINFKVEDTTRYNNKGNLWKEWHLPIVDSTSCFNKYCSRVITKGVNTADQRRL